MGSRVDSDHVGFHRRRTSGAEPRAVSSRLSSISPGAQECTEKFHGHRSAVGPTAGEALYTGEAWYEELRERYRPERLRYLLIAESPPDSGQGERRFFYSPVLTIDNLYRAVAEAVYGGEGVDIRNKPAVLERLRADGFWLIDAVEHPINNLPSAARARTIRDAVPSLVSRCIDLSPERGTIICHAKVYSLAAQALRQTHVHVLHDEALPFPLGNFRTRFVEGFRRSLRP